MNTKWIFRIGIGFTALASLYYIFIQSNLGLGVLMLMAATSLTNGARAQSLYEKGEKREAKWMFYLAAFFGVAFVSLLLILLIK